MPREPRVLVSLLNWNGGASIVRCLEQLRLQTFPHARVIVVDNGSTDGSIEAIRLLEPSLTVLESPENRGFAGGHNVAIRYGLREGFEYFWLLNHDTTFEPGTLAALVQAADGDRGIGAMSPAIYQSEQPEQIQFCGTWMDIQQVGFRNARDFSELDAYESSGASHLLLWGTALLVTREAIQAAGLLDERYFAYYEDLDFTDRIHNAGFRNRVIRNARIWHSGVTSINSRPPYFVYYNVRNQHLYWRERLSAAGRLRMRRLLARRTLRLIAELKEGSGPDWIDATLCGFRDGLLGRFGAWDQRRRVPRWLHVLATAHPYALQCVLDGRFIALSSDVAANLRRRIRPRPS